jgi:hypothetical protein
MTEAGTHGYDRLLDDFGRRLEASAALPTKRLTARAERLTARPFTRVAPALLLAGAAVGVAALVLAGGGGSRLDVLAQARAELAPPGQIVHLITTTHFENRGGPRPAVGTSSTGELWSASDPPRWRASISIPTPTSTPGGKPLKRSGGLVTGRMQFSYADGTAESYFQQVNTLEVTSGLSDTGPEASPSGLAGLGIEPVAQIRSLLATGRLHDAGAARVNGHAVRRLLGSEPHGRYRPRLLEYDVDAATFAPVRVIVETFAGERSSRVGVATEVIDVDAYARIPLNGATSGLLRIQPRGRPVVRRVHFARVRTAP